MSDGDEKYKLGELTADMAAVKHDVEEIKQTNKEIIKKIDGLNAVTIERWEKRNAHVDSKLLEHDKAIKALEDINTLRASSIWSRIANAFETNLVKYIGAGLLVFALSIAYVYIRNDIIHNSVPNVSNKQ